jgi:hypothetical protein
LTCHTAARQTLTIGYTYRLSDDVLGVPDAYKRSSSLPIRISSASSSLAMCHASPTAQLLNSLIAITFVIFLLWHIFKLDKGRTLVYTSKDAFRWCESPSRDHALTFQ